MKNVHFLIDKTKIVDYLVTPVRINRKNLRERGYNLKFYYGLTNECLSCDILLFTSKFVLKSLNEKKTIINEPSPTIDLLKKARLYSNKIIWLDSSDSTSVTHFELLPYIDSYLKKQLYKDISLYTKNLYGGRIFSQFYHDKFGINDSETYIQYFPLDLKYSNKVNLSWNIGLGDMYNAFSKWNLIKSKFPNLIKHNYNVKFISPRWNKDIDIFLKTTTNLYRQTVAFHRKELIKRLENILFNHKMNGHVQGNYLPIKEFRDRMIRSRIIPSPFGWGELGVRDYEAFIYGAVLLKPDLSHMDTWPNIFFEGETYQPFNWDFTNLENSIIELIDNEPKRIRLAENGQNAYKESISKQGMEKFCDWFIQQIEK